MSVKTNKKYVKVSKEDRDDRLELSGRIVEAKGGTLFVVEISGGAQVLASPAGRLRQNNIRLIPGDKVTVEVSPFDLTRGRITWRSQ